MFSLVKLVEGLQTDWLDFLKPIAENHALYIDLTLRREYEETEIYPPPDLILAAFNRFNIRDLNAVIIGQDCYSNPGEACGFAFSVDPRSVRRIPPSLQNILAAVRRDTGKPRDSPDLRDWADQGVLLLNTALTVRKQAPGSHIPLWSDFINDVIAALPTGICYMLWGAHAMQYQKLASKPGNLVLTHSHPSPLARKPFDTCTHFTQCNEFLKRTRGIEINWSDT